MNNCCHGNIAKQTSREHSIVDKKYGSHGDKAYLRDTIKVIF